MLGRVLDSARRAHAGALCELQAGAKTGHWVWYVFPVHKQHCAGSRPDAAMRGLTEAVEYLRHTELRNNYLAVLRASDAAMQATSVAAKGTGRAPWRVFDSAFHGRKPVGKGMLGPCDAFKVRASVTLFCVAAVEVGDGEVEAACRAVLGHYIDSARLRMTNKPPMVGPDPDMLQLLGRPWPMEVGAVVMPGASAAAGPEAVGADRAEAATASRKTVLPATTVLGPEES